MPVVAVAPQRKLVQLMEDAGLAAYCVELQEFSAGGLIRCLAGALDNESQLRPQVRDRAERFRKALAPMYDDIATRA